MPVMTQKQLDLYHNNFVKLSKGFNIAGGASGYILASQQNFLEQLARNGLEVNITFHTDMEDEC